MKTWFHDMMRAFSPAFAAGHEGRCYPCESVQDMALWLRGFALACKAVA